MRSLTRAFLLPAALAGGVALVAGCETDLPTAGPAGTDFATLDAPVASVALTPHVVREEAFQVCKTYVGTPGPTVTFDVTVDAGNDGTIDHTFAFDLADGQCEDIWGKGGAVADLVTVTEQAPAGYVSSFERITSDGGVVTSDGEVAGVATSGLVAGVKGVLVEYYNTSPPVEGIGRMTGGGFQVRMADGVRITRGFTIHCDITLSNNVQINWKGGNKWHIIKPLTMATCIDDPAVEPAPPPAPFDTFIGEGVGKLNGVDGSIVRFTFVDAGEPGGGNDKAGIKIWAPGADPNVDTPVLDVPFDFLTNGNIQAHFDQPHS
jgi:hypothetical protein